MNRIELLRQEALSYTICRDTFHYHFHTHYAAHADQSPEQRYAGAFSNAFANLTPVISDGELIVGKYTDTLTDEQRQQWHDTWVDATKAACAHAGPGQDSHMAIDYELLLSCGLRGIMDRIDRYLETCAPEKQPFYECCKACLLAVIRYSERYADHARALAGNEPDPVRREELLRLAQICRKVPVGPAETFYEAVQSVHFVSHALSANPFRSGSQQFQLGHPDRYLLPFYEKDLAENKITRQQAQLLLDCLGIMINIRVPNGLSSGYMVGGRDCSGRVVANELTEMCMQVIDDIRLVYPSVGLCVTKDTPRRYLQKACEILSHGRSHPAIFNDDVITRGLQHYGVTEAESHSYIHSTCVEITPVAASNVWVASPYTNMPQLLLDTMTREYDSFADHLAAVYALLDERIARNFERENNNRKIRAENSMNPLLSCLVNDCLARGLDIEKGGARYNWIMPSFVGMANLVDSLYALKAVVYDQKQLTVCAFREILDRNFAGSEELQQYLAHTLPKYGNDLDEIDGFFSEIVSHIVAQCKKYTGMHTNGNLIPSVFCWIMHERFGRDTGATPDGRCAGFPLGDGSGPCQGREFNGPTASILSSTKWDHTTLIGGVAVNMKFSKNTLGEKSLDVMQSLIQAYLERGGFEIQINVTDRKTLEDAVRHPEQYRDLVVRIGGYSDYFTKLPPQMQQEVILRTEHRI